MNKGDMSNMYGANTLELRLSLFAKGQAYLFIYFINWVLALQKLN